jgi:hypothetical protein
MNKLIVEIKKELGSKIFSVSFYKKDGTLREMTCRLGVTKHLKGGELSHNPSDFGHLIVYDMKSEGYRTINLNTLVKIKFEGKEYNFENN